MDKCDWERISGGNFWCIDVETQSRMSFWCSNNRSILDREGDYVVRNSMVWSSLSISGSFGRSQIEKGIM